MSKIRASLLVVLLAAGLMLYVLGYVIYGFTLIAPWVPPVVGGAVAVVSGIPLAGKWAVVTRSGSRWVDWGVHVFIVGAVAYCGFLGLNYWYADEASASEETVVVEDRSHKETTRTRRVGRHRFVADGVRHTYFQRIRFADGRAKEISVSRNEYRRYAPGSERVVVVSTGLFGVPVVRH